MTEQLYFARRCFTYGIPGQDLDFGQVITLSGVRNDEKLLEYGHLVKFDTKGGRVAPVECNKCGSKFADPGVLMRHGSKRHPISARTQQQEDEMLENEDRFIAQIAPLNMGGESIEVQPSKKRRGRPPKSAQA